MKYIITSYEENIHETVVLITEADSKESLLNELIALSKPYNDALADRKLYIGDTSNKKDKNYHLFDNYCKLQHSNILFRGKEFPVYYFADMNNYEIYPLQEFLNKHTLNG